MHFIKLHPFNYCTPDKPNATTHHLRGRCSMESFRPIASELMDIHIRLEPICIHAFFTLNKDGNVEKRNEKTHPTPFKSHYNDYCILYFVFGYFLIIFDFVCQKKRKKRRYISIFEVIYILFVFHLKKMNEVKYHSECRYKIYAYLHV